MGRHGLPIAAQVLMLMLAGLLVAQIVTVSIALLLPQRRAAGFQLVDIAAALRGGPLPQGPEESLVRTRQQSRPVANGGGWIPLMRTRDDLARILQVTPDQVEVLYFIAPPFAGASNMVLGPAPPGVGPGPPPWAGPQPNPWWPPVSANAARQRFIPPPRDWGGPRAFRPFVNGAFVAALRTPSGWIVIRSTTPGLLSSWERRLLIWFAASFAVIGPVGYLFARHLTAPLAAFACAAEQLGRDSRAPPLAVNGPAEVKRAARALNSMQVRLQRHLDDRTAMIGAISHDLRTPLARLKFRLERVEPGARAPMLADIAQMEAMLSSVLTFIRDAADPGARERVDLRSIVECVVDDADLMGAPVTLKGGPAIFATVDPGSIQRVLANLVDNAVKYGGAAEVRLERVEDEALVTILDHGPGLPPEELGRVFEPFYRASGARTLNGEGVGLGLSIARSIARAHGGEVELRAAAQGLVAELRLPLASS